MDGTRVSIEVTDAPLRDVLERLALDAGFVLKRVGALDARVGLRLDDVPLAQALKRLLGDLSYMIHFAPPAGPGAPRQVARVLVIDRARNGAAPMVEIVRPGQKSSPRSTAERLAGQSKQTGADENDRTSWEDAVKAQTVHMLGRDDPATVDALIEALDKETSPRVREAAAAALSGVAIDDAAERSVLSSLTRALDDPEPRVRYQAIRALGGTGSAQALNSLIDVLRSSEDPNERTLAARALANYSSASARQALLVAKQDDEPSVRAAAEMTLAGLQRRSGRGALTPLPDAQSGAITAQRPLLLQSEQRRVSQ